MSEPIEIPAREGYPVYTLHLRVRHYELDSLGHVNNAVYLNYMEQAAIDHATALGFSQARLRELGGVWVVRRHEIDYLGAASGGDELAVTTWPESLGGVRAVRCCVVQDVITGKRLIAARTLWVWIDLKTGRPHPHPREIMETFAFLTHRTVDELEE